jgi:hypothetical protein
MKTILNGQPDSFWRDRRYLSALFQRPYGWSAIDHFLIFSHIFDGQMHISATGSVNYPTSDIFTIVTNP